MDLKKYLMALSPSERGEFALRCGTTIGHLTNVANGHKPCSPELAVAIERESAGDVRGEGLTQKLDWAYIRSGAAHLTADHPAPVSPTTTTQEA